MHKSIYAHTQAHTHQKKRKKGTAWTQGKRETHGTTQKTAGGTARVTTDYRRAMVFCSFLHFLNSTVSSLGLAT